jgi:hypothetical protein
MDELVDNGSYILEQIFMNTRHNKVLPALKTHFVLDGISTFVFSFPRQTQAPGPTPSWIPYPLDRQLHISPKKTWASIYPELVHASMCSFVVYIACGAVTR